ncbi:hypothetical protein AaE_013387, partial [Aphanomyces astaci]
MAVKLPLPANFFQCPPLTPFEVDHLQQQALQSAMDVYDKLNIPGQVRKTQLLGGKVKWALRSDEVDLKIYKGDDPNAMPGSYLYMGVMEVVGTLDEVIELFQTRTTEQAKEHMRRFGKQLVDAVKLYSLVEPSPESPGELIGVHWRAYKSPLSLFVAKRDACLLECNHGFELNGRRGWVTSLKSINLTSCPELQHLLGLIRLQNYGSGHVFLECPDRPGYLEMRFVAQLDFRGVSYDYVSDSMLKRRAWVSDINMTKRCRSLQDIDRFLREDRLGRGAFLTAKQLVSKTKRAHCFICNLRFGWNHAKSNCYKCGEVVCSTCNHNWCIKVHGAKTYLKACVRCALGVVANGDTSKPPLSTIHSGRPYGSRSSSSDHSNLLYSTSHQKQLAHQQMYPQYPRTTTASDDGGYNHENQWELEESSQSVPSNNWENALDTTADDDNHCMTEYASELSLTPRSIRVVSPKKDRELFAQNQQNHHLAYPPL